MPLVSLTEASGLLASGGLLVFPTETVFGIGCCAQSQSSVDAILSRKQRGGCAGMPILVSGISIVNTLVVDATSILAKQRQELQDSFWPGALTIVVDVKNGSGFACGLAAADGSVAMRFSSLLNATILAQSTSSGCLVATSANRQGQRPVCTTEEALAEFPDLPVVEGICDSRAIASTIVDVRSSPFKIIRQGVIKLPD